MKKLINIYFLIASVLLNAQITFQSESFEKAVRDFLEIDSSAMIYINQLDTIQDLDLSNHSIENVKDIYYFSNLKKLNLENNKVIDISPLISLPNIETINLSYNELENIDMLALSDAVSLKLIVSGNYIKDFSIFKEPLYSVVELIGEDRQMTRMNKTFGINQLFTSTDNEGQANIFYHIWSDNNDCGQFTLTTGDGKSYNDLLCNQVANQINHNYNKPGFKEISITRGNELLKTHFVAPYQFDTKINTEMKLDLNLPDDITLISTENNPDLGSITIDERDIVYNAIKEAKDTITVEYTYKQSERREFFKIFVNNAYSLNTNDIDKKDLVKLFPNPTKGIIYIQSPYEIKAIELFDMSGKFLQQINNFNRIDLTQYPTGKYILKIRTKNDIIFKSVIKE